MNYAIKMVENGPPLDPGKLRILETYIGVSLASEYRLFLKEHNGGIPEEDSIDFVLPDGTNAGDRIQRFYELSDNVAFGLMPNMVNVGWQIPRGFIFIATTPAGNFFLLGVAQEYYGKIFYKDHELEDEPYQEDGLPANVVKVTNSFSEFLKRLYDPDA